MKIMGVAAGELAVGEGFDFFGFNDHDVVGVLDLAFDDEKVFLRDEEALFFEELRRDDGVGDAGFVFEADEDKTFGGAGSLTANDVAGDANALAVAGFWEIRGAPNIFELGTQQSHRVRAGC